MDVLRLVAARIAIGEQASEEMPEIATAALVRGIDSQLLREAAGISPRDVRDARELLVAAFEELGIPIPPEEEALWILTKDTAERICSRTLDPYEGARWIWCRVHWRIEREGDLRIFVGLASECDDHPDLRPAIEELIREAAQQLLERGELRRWVTLEARPGTSALWDGSTEVDLEELPLGDRVKLDVTEWASEYDRAQAYPGAAPSGFSSRASAERFVERGARLAEAIQRELGDSWHVEYMPTARAVPT